MTLLALNRPFRNPASWLALLGIAVAGVFAVVVILTTPDDLSAPSAVGRAPVAVKAVAPAAATASAIAPQVFEAVTPDEAVAINSAAPISSLPNPAAAPFKLSNVSEFDRARAVNCLAMAVYYEAANQGDQGEAAVAQVVLNRMRNPLFPKTVCGVVFQGSNLPTGCQFTFTCDGSLARPPSADGWARAKAVAERALGGYVEKSVGEATHYHTIWVVPYWQSTVLKVAQIGAHVFYRWSGGLGQPGAFNGAYAGAEPLTPTPTGLAAQDVAAMAAPIPLSTPIAAATPRAEEPKPEIKMVTAAAAPAPALATVPDVTPGPVSYFGGSNDDRPHRLPIAGR
jgi:spore germination cell wall hydrolase CwlJ-like protein